MIINKEPYRSIEGSDSEHAKLRAEATVNSEASQAGTPDNLTSVDSASDPVVAPAMKRARRVRSQPVSGTREQRARKRSQAVNVDAELEREPELLSGLETGPAPTEPSHSPDSAAECFVNGSLNAAAGTDWPPHGAPTADRGAAPQDDNVSHEPPLAEEAAIDSAPSNWIANGSEHVELDGSTPAETSPAPAAADFHDIKREEQAADSAPTRARKHRTDEAFEHRWQHNEYARQPEPEAFAGGASIVGNEPSDEPDPRVDAGTIASASSKSLAGRIRHSLRVQLTLIALVPILLGSLIPAVIALLSPDVFAARSEIVLNISSLDWSAAERFRATQLVVVKARSTLVPISESMSIPLRDLERDIQVGMMGSSDVISIQYANRDPATALAVVNAVTAQYLIDLRDFEQIRNGRHRILLPATLLDDPVSLSPLRAAVIGAIVGFVIAIAGIVLRTQIRPIK